MHHRMKAIQADLLEIREEISALNHIIDCYEDGLRDLFYAIDFKPGDDLGQHALADALVNLRTLLNGD